MDWVLPLTNDMAFDYGFSFTMIVWAKIVGVIISVKVVKEVFRR
jgi:hypothetical protein